MVQDSTPSTSEPVMSKSLLWIFRGFGLALILLGVYWIITKMIYDGLNNDKCYTPEQYAVDPTWYLDNFDHQCSGTRWYYVLAAFVIGIVLLLVAMFSYWDAYVCISVGKIVDKDKVVSFGCESYYVVIKGMTRAGTEGVQRISVPWSVWNKAREGETFDRNAKRY